MSAFRRLLNHYNNFVIKYPLVGMSLTSGVGGGVGNLLCQAIMYNEHKKIDLFNAFQYASYGLLISGPVLRYWWYALDLKIFRNPNSFLRPVKMMLVDQATTPYVLNGCFLFYLSYTGGKSFQASIDDAKKKMVPLVFESYKVWPLTTLLNFYLIPLHNRVLFSNAVAILWTTYVTYYLHLKNKHH